MNNKTKPTATYCVPTMPDQFANETVTKGETPELDTQPGIDTHREIGQQVTALLEAIYNVTGLTTQLLSRLNPVLNQRPKDGGMDSQSRGTAQRMTPLGNDLLRLQHLVENLIAEVQDALERLEI